MSLKKLSLFSLQFYFTPRPHLKVEIFEKSWFASLDTGSSLSFINKEVITQCLLRDHLPVTDNSSVKLANGSVIISDEIYKLKVKAVGEVWDLHFHIMPSSDSAIIFGIDVISKLNLSIPPTPWHLICQNSGQEFSTHVNLRGPIERRSIRIQTDSNEEENLEENRTGQKRKFESPIIPAAPRKKKQKNLDGTPPPWSTMLDINSPSYKPVTPPMNSKEFPPEKATNFPSRDVVNSILRPRVTQNLGPRAKQQNLPNDYL